MEQLGILTEVDMAAFAGYCQAYARWKEAEEFIRYLEDGTNKETIVESASRKKEKKNPPLLYNLAETAESMLQDV